METKHTPTPYTLLGGTRIWLTGAAERFVGSIHRPEDAAFIVKACNSHAALLEALSAVYEGYQHGMVPYAALDKAQVAIAKAKAEQS